jgi:hypothetical protein
MGNPRPIGASRRGIERFAKLRFRQANGAIVEGWVGPAFIHAAVMGERVSRTSS